MKGSHELTSSSASDSQPSRARTGAELYANTCAKCHGAIESSAKKGANAALITSALNNIGAMQALKPSLSAADIQSIADALNITNPVAPLQPGGLSASTVKTPLGTRLYMASAFRDIFSAGPTDTAIESLIDQLLVQRADQLGGLASRFDGDYDAVKNSDRYYSYKIVEHRPNAGVVGLTSVTRQGFISRACEEVLQNDSAVTNALRRAGSLNTTSPANDDNIKSVYELFTFGEAPGSQVLTDLKALHARGRQISATEAWRFTLLAICLNPAFQAL